MIAEKLRQVADNLPLVYEAGMRECQNRHFAAVVTGNGSMELTLPVSFEPDLIEVVSHNPAIRAVKGILASCQIDLSALGQIGGMFSMTSGPGTGSTLGTYSNILMATPSLETRCRRNADGTLTLGNFTYDTMQGIWGEGVEYLVTAVKSVEKNDRQRIEESIRRLPEDGAYKIHILKKKMEAAFTQEEWDDLIAERPGYTFVMV